MKIAVYTLTRDRLEYTKRMVRQLKETAGINYDHYILDNGSVDSTKEWIAENHNDNITLFISSAENLGLWKGISKIKEATNNFEGYDYVIKIDNDMQFYQKNWLRDLIKVYEERDFDVLSPFVDGVCNGKGGIDRLYDENGIGVVEHVGGACLLSTPEYYDEDLPNGYMATGWDTWFCTGLKCGIVEDIHVLHDSKTMEKENKEYHKRQRKEEKIRYGD